MPPEKIFAPLEKCVENSLKNLDPSQKTLRPRWCPKLVTTLLKTKGILSGNPVFAYSLPGVRFSSLTPSVTPLEFSEAVTADSGKPRNIIAYCVKRSMSENKIFIHSVTISS